MQIPVIVYKDEDGVLIAESPVLPWFHTYWKDEKELFENLKELAELYKELIENGEIPVNNYEYVMNYLLNVNIDSNVTNNIGKRATKKWTLRKILRDLDLQFKDLKK